MPDHDQLKARAARALSKIAETIDRRPDLLEPGHKFGAFGLNESLERFAAWLDHAEQSVQPPQQPPQQ